MSATSFDIELQVNRRAYAAMRERIRRDLAGQYVAIAHGRVVGTGDSYDEALAAVKQLHPAPPHYIVFEADQEPAFDLIDDFAGRF